MFLLALDIFLPKINLRKDKTKAITTKGNGYIITEQGLQILKLNLSIKSRPAYKIQLQEKKCSRCKVIKPINDFVDSSGLRNHRGKYCSECHIDISFENLRNILEGREFCLYCGSEIISMCNSDNDPLLKWKDIHRDHMDPISLGGEDTDENTIYCCANCNIKKGNKLFSDWFLCLEEKYKTISRNVYIQKHKRNPEDFKTIPNEIIITLTI